MRRRLYEGLLGGAEAALAWQRARTVRSLASRSGRLHVTELALAIARWEHEGGALSAGALRAAP